MSYGQTGSSDYDIYGQRYDLSGDVVGGEFKINTGGTGTSQYTPSISALSDGGFVVTWASSNDGDRYGVYGQRYDASGATAGSQFSVNSYITGEQDRPSVAGLAGGGFVVTWRSYTPYPATSQDGSGPGVFAQLYDEGGARVGGEFQVNTTTFSNQEGSAVVPLSDGGFVVAWMSFNQDESSTWGIYGQRYNYFRSDPWGRVPNQHVHDRPSGESPSIAPLGDGGFVVTLGVPRSRRRRLGHCTGSNFDASGTAIGEEFRLK